MRRMARLLSGVLVVCAWMVVSAAAPQEPGGRVRARIRAAVAGGKIPSMAVAVGRGDRVIWSAAFGFADKARRVAATPTTAYSIASVTKPFTATALMVLVERGQVRLDEPIGGYLGPLSRPGVRDPSGVTVRRTLGHVAGFPLHYQFFYADRPARPLPFPQRLQCFGAETSPPGTRYVYSNLGFGVLDEIVSRVSGLPFGAFMAREVFEPLGLTNAIVPQRAEQASAAATRYGRDGEPLPFYVTDHDGASALYASVEDLVRFGLFHAGSLSPSRPVLTAESRAAMQQPGLGGYGLGWSVNPDWSGRRVVWHSGGMPGVAATLWVVPEERIAIALASNQLGAPVNQLAGEILADLLDVTPPSGTGPGAPDEAPGDPRPDPTPPPDVRGHWRGTLGSCSGNEALVLEVRGRHDIGVMPGQGSSQVVQSADAQRGRVRGVFRGEGDMGLSEFQFDLQARGGRLEGPVIRSTGLGSRGSVRVTLWASLGRD